MLTLQANLKDSGRKPVVDEYLIRFGQSTIEPFASSLINYSISSGRDFDEIWIGEGPEPCNDESSEHRRSATAIFTEFEGVRIQLSGGPSPEVTITRTAAGTTPLYLASNGPCLTASWKFELAVSILDRAVPNIEACRIFLDHGKAQVREQIIAGVFMLWPGESVAFDASGLRFTPMDDPAVVLSSAMNDGARATDEFLRLIGEAMRRPLANATSPLIEISGGFDSSCVAIAAAALRQGLTSYGVIQPGAVGTQQQNRRQELIDLLGFPDHEGPSWDPLPTRSLDYPECRVTPYDDLYRMACLKTIDRHDLHHCDIVISGIGGDELTKEFTFFREPWEVPGFASSSALVAATSRADMFMRRGIWPVNPLLDIQVINFCRALPKKMRENRLLNVLTLARAGLSDGYIVPRLTENFGNVLTLEGVELDYNEFFETSVIGDYGIADVYAPLAEVAQATQDGVSKRMVGKMYTTLKLEMTLRSYIR